MVREYSIHYIGHVCIKTMRQHQGQAVPMLTSRTFNILDEIKRVHHMIKISNVRLIWAASMDIKVTHY